MPRLPIIAALCLAATAGAAQQPYPTPAPNAPAQQPAFAGQTRAPRMATATGIEIQPLVRGLARPWAVAPLPGGGALITERPGRLRLYTPDGRLSDPIKGVPQVHTSGQGGLLDVTPDPDFARNRLIYLSFAEARGGGNGTAVARARLSDDGTALEGTQIIFRQQPAWNSDLHFGSRLVFAPDGSLFVTLGERSRPQPRQLAQDPGTHLGKVVRILPDGRVPGDNPFIGQPGALPENWAIGFRNVQAAAMDGRGRLWTVEHGPRGGDELNLVQRGGNHGWPVITYGIDYSGAPIGDGLTAKDGMIQPVYYWDPVIAPSGALFYRGDLFREWRGDLLIGAMNPPGLVRLRLQSDRVVGEDRVLPDLGRIRDLAEGPDGAIWLVTDANNGSLLRLVPR